MKKKSTQPFLNTRASVILWANWFQFAEAERALSTRVLSRMLLWCQEGRGRVRVNGVWHAMQPDDFLFLPWQHEVLYLADAREPFWVGGIHIIPDHATDRKLIFSVSHNIKDDWAKCPWRRDRAWPGLEGVRAGVARSQDPLRLLAAYIVERFEEGSMPEASLRKLSQVLVEEIARTVAQKESARVGNDTVRRVQELVESHLGRPLPLRDLARLAQCSVSTLRRQFQQTLGIPPYEWILQARIRRARRLLATTTLRIKEIAGQVGFDDPFQFSRAFKQRTGSSPRQFRKNHAFAPK
ncbi:MAG: AraC family transcriptional regulator [Methylacidiphilales bacterium]|nr:AraC family transcriptional regulator [Candidatus Methylacidiphilales bacterium]